MAYAKAAHALGLCDRCSWQYPLRELRDSMTFGTRSGILVCPTCYDEGTLHPISGGKTTTFPAEAIDVEIPRPDNGSDRSIASFPRACGWETRNTYGRINVA